VLSLLLALRDTAPARQAGAGLIKQLPGFRAEGALSVEELDSWCGQHALDAVLGDPEAAALAAARGERRGDDEDDGADDLGASGSQLLHFTQLLRQLNGPLEAPALGLSAADASLGAAAPLQLLGTPAPGVQLLRPAQSAPAKGAADPESPTSVLDGPEGAAGRQCREQAQAGAAAGLAAASAAAPAAAAAAAAAAQVPDAENLVARQQLEVEQQIVESALAAVSGSAACLAQVKGEPAR
jgi:hypothetical protein